MIFLYISGAIFLLILYFVIKKLIQLRMTWNEHKSLVFNIDRKTDYLLTAYNQIARKQNEIKEEHNNINAILNEIKNEIKNEGKLIAKKVNAVQYELFINNIEKLAEEFRGKKYISEKKLKEIKKILHNYRMDNRIKEILNKK